MAASCAIDGCDNAAKARGWCRKHHTRWLRHGDPHVVLAGGGVPKPKQPCSVDGCGQPMHAKGKCSTHYQQERYGHTPKPSQVHPLRGGVWDNTACFDCGAPPVCGGKWCRPCWDSRRPSARPSNQHRKLDPGRTPVVQARLENQRRRWVA